MFGGIAAQTYGQNDIYIRDSYNVGFIESNPESKGHIGGIVGNGSTLYGLVSISGCSNSAEVQGSEADEQHKWHSAGGIVGMVYPWGNGAKIEVMQCSNKGKVTGSYHTGGIIGYANQYSGLISLQDSYNTGEVHGENRLGGVIGSVDVGESGSAVRVKKTYNSGKTIGNNALAVGGIIGEIKDTAQSYQKQSGEVEVKNCYNLGVLQTDMSKSDQLIGGIVGNIDNRKGKITIEQNYNSGDINASGNNIGGIIGKETVTDNGTNTINQCCYKNNCVGAISGQDVEDSAYAVETLPNILTIIGDKFTEDTTNINGGNPILK